MDGYGSKIRKVSRCRPVVSNETLLATKQEFFFTKVAPVQSMADTVPSGFWLNNFFFEYLYFSEYGIRMFLFVFG